MLLALTLCFFVLLFFCIMLDFFPDLLLVLPMSCFYSCFISRLRPCILLNLFNLIMFFLFIFLLGLVLLVSYRLFSFFLFNCLCFIFVSSFVSLDYSLVFVFLSLLLSSFSLSCLSSFCSSCLVFLPCLRFAVFLFVCLPIFFYLFANFMFFVRFLFHRFT